MQASRDGRAHLRALHYGWPVLMGGSMVAVVHRAIARPADGAGLALLLSGILAAYSLDRILDRPHVAPTAWLRTSLHAAAAAGVTASAVLLTLIPLPTAMLVPVLGVLVLAYPRLKALPLLKTLVVSAAWTWSVIALPFPDGSWIGWRAWTEPVAIPLTLVVASGCLLCDLKDVDTDRAASVPSLPVVLGRRGTIVSAMALAAGGTAIALAEHRMGLFAGGLGLALASGWSNVLAREAVGPLLVDIILTIPGVLIVLNLV